MKTMKKYLAFMISLFMIAALWPATVYASVEEGDAAEEIWDAVEEAPMPELTEESVAEPIEAVSDEETSEVEAISPDEPSGLIADEPSATEAEEIEEEVPENVGAGVQVGDGVTATFDADTGEVKFTSNGGTLWKDWLSKSGFQKNKIESIRSTGKLYLPSDSSFIFSECLSLTNLDLSSFDTSNVTDMNHMFYHCIRLTNLDLSSFNTSNVTNMCGMFEMASGFWNYLTNLDLSSFDTSNVTDMNHMFYNCISLTNLDLSNFDTSNVTDMNHMFYHCIRLTNLDLSSFDTSNVTDISYMFYWCERLTNLDLSGFDTSNVTDISYMFYGCESLTNLNLSSFDTSNVTDMNHMFCGCESLTNLDLSSFDTSNVTDMSNMFEDCIILTKLDLSNFNTSNVTDMNHMFNKCSSLTNLDLSSFNTSNVTDMDYMFSGCSSLTNLNLSSFDTLNVTDMEGMFSICPNLTNLDLSSFNTSNVTNMAYMFWECSSLKKLDLSNFDTSNVTSMYYMFYKCSSLTNLDLSSFDTSNLKTMASMFSECTSLTNLNLSSFNTSNVTYASDVFNYCKKLEILYTPQKHSINNTRLPYTMYDRDGNAYTALPVLSHSIILGKTQEIAYDLSRKAISECAITLKTTSYTYDGKSKKPAVTIKDGSKVLTSGTDYTVVYSKNKNAGKAVVTITAVETSDYKGTATVNFTIKKADAGLAFAESSITKKSTDAAFTNPLTKATAAEATFTSSNTSVATVDSATGEVTLKAAGTATITAQTAATTNYNAGTASYNLKVEKPVNGFSDVQDPTHPYYNAIYWAAEAGITKGYSDGTFGINRDCTRGEMMMFLWRYAGKPAPAAVSKSPFTDVPTTHAFYKAILWGSQKGITKGYSDGTFGINKNVSRGECMMFLWRLKGKPLPNAVWASPFKDVPMSHTFFKAILWGSQKGVTKGYTSGPKKGNFGINDNCTRGQIVTFLYRAKDL